MLLVLINQLHICLMVKLLGLTIGLAINKIKLIDFGVIFDLSTNFLLKALNNFENIVQSKQVFKYFIFQNIFFTKPNNKGLIDNYF